MVRLITEKWIHTIGHERIQFLKQSVIIRKLNTDIRKINITRETEITTTKY